MRTYRGCLIVHITSPEWRWKACTPTGVVYASSLEEIRGVIRSANPQEPATMPLLDNGKADRRYSVAPGFFGSRTEHWGAWFLGGFIGRAATRAEAAALCREHNQRRN